MNLIYDRTQTDINNALAIRSKYQTLGDWSGITEEETEQLKRGTYTCFDDMNRVDAAVRDIGAKLTAAGYPVRYTSPIPKTEKPLTNFTLKSDDFQQAPYLYATGEHDTQYADDYISTKAMIDVSANQKIYITTNVDLLQDSGFVWYDKNRQFISGAKSEDISKYSMSATPPQNAQYCNININSTGIIPNNIQNVNVIYNGVDDYIELTYIQSSGTQYIDTGYKPNSNTRVVCKIFGMDTSHGSEAVFGARTSTSATDKFMFLVTDNANYRTDYGNNNAEFAKSVNFTGEFEIDKNKNVTILNKATQISNSAYTFSSTLNLYLFASNTGGTASTFTYGMGAIYYKIYDNDILVRDYITAIQNGRTGLYDKVESKMYYSNGTDDFIAGEVVIQPETPDEPDYTIIEKLSYAQTISSEPAMYHIDTGLSIKQGDTVNISLSYDILAVKYDDRECVLLSFPPAQSPPIIGRALIRNHGIRQKQIYLGGQISNYQTQVITYTQFGTYQNSVEEVYYSSNPEQFSNCTAQLIITSDKIYTLCAIGTNQLYKSEIPSIDFWSTAERKILLLQEDQNNINENASYYRFKKLEIEINGEKHKFVPCKNENNKVGFLDEFDNSIVYNELGGVLLPGEVTETVKIPKPIFYLGDIINYDIWRTYLDNVQAIRDAYYTMPDTPKLPEPTAPLNFDGANAIEKLLYDVQVLYNAMSASYRKCGTFTSGNNYQRQFIRSV